MRPCGSDDYVFNLQLCNCCKYITVVKMVPVIGLKIAKCLPYRLLTFI